MDDLRDVTIDQMRKAAAIWKAAMASRGIDGRMLDDLINEIERLRGELATVSATGGVARIEAAKRPDV